MKFSIRDILWLTILVAVVMAWWLDRRVTTRRLEALHQQVQIERVQREMELARALMLEALAKAQQVQAENALERAHLLEQARSFYEEQSAKTP